MFRFLSKIRKFVDGDFAIILSIFAFFLYFSISLLKHYFLQTNAFDLGIFSQTVWKFSKFDFFAFNSIREKIALGDHLDLILIPFAIIKIPFFFIKTSTFLLFLQSLFLAIGSVGIYKFSRIFFDKSISYFFQFLFLFLPGTQTAMLFDFHTLTISATIFPWLFWSLFSKEISEKKSKFLIFILTILILFCREDQGIVLSLFFFSTAIFQKNWRLLSLSFFSGIFSIFAIFFIIPKIFGSGYIYDSMYSGGFSQVLEITIFKPNLFLQEITNSSVKIEFLTYFLIFGGAFLVFVPEFFPLFLILIAQKLLTKYESTWGLKFHYSSIFSPFLILIIVLSFNRLKNFFYEIYLSLSLLIIKIFHKVLNFQNFFKIFSKSFSISLLVFFFFFSFSFRSQIFLDLNLSLSKIFITKTSATESNFFKSIDKIIPKNSSVSTQSNLVPHFSERNKVYLFPDGIFFAEFIVLSNTNGESYVWPLSPTEKDKLTRELIQDPRFSVLFVDDDFLILKKV